MATIDGWSFYKIKIKGKMTPENIRTKCLENGMTPACYCNDNCIYTDSGCTITPNNGEKYTGYALSQALCGNRFWLRCQALNDIFYYIANKNGYSFGVQSGKRTSTRTLTSLWSMCTKQH